MQKMNKITHYMLEMTEISTLNAENEGKHSNAEIT